MRRFVLLTVTALSLAGTSALAERQKPPVNPQIDYQGYVALAQQAGPLREARLIGLGRFQQMATQEGALVLDARSAQAFAEGHIAGAVNLPLPDFTAEALAEVIGSSDRPILIYCNNNFSNHTRPVPLKSVQLALNIQTFINLHGYGYTNVYELSDVVDFNDPSVRWVRQDQG
jgi:hypothetical protein